MANIPERRTLTLEDGQTIAYRVREGKGSAKSSRSGNPGVFSLVGMKSEMDGQKAIEADRFAKARGLGSVRFDYFGHGASSGEFEKGTISRWLADTLAVFDEVAKGPQIVVGASLGGWLALLLTLARPERVKGLVLIAPAPDFTALLLEDLPEEAKALFDEGKPWPKPSIYSTDPYPISKALLEDGQNHLLLKDRIEIVHPVRILHGMEDSDVPWERSLTLIDQLASNDVALKLVKDGDHRLSDERGLRTLEEALRDILAL
jgi:pimeloyl-ACP methyl ester carboxylesterase